MHRPSLKWHLTPAACLTANYIVNTPRRWCYYAAGLVAWVMPSLVGWVGVGCMSTVGAGPLHRGHGGKKHWWGLGSGGEKKRLKYRNEFKDSCNIYYLCYFSGVCCVGMTQITCWEDGWGWMYVDYWWDVCLCQLWGQVLFTQGSGVKFSDGGRARWGKETQRTIK